MSAAVHHVAILLPTYNGVRFLEEQLASLQWQLDACVRVFIRDDHSTDSTPALLEDLSKRFPDIIILVRDDRGKGGGSGSFFYMIAGLDLAGFDYVAFCDQDDIWAPRKLAASIAAMNAAGAGGYSSNLFSFESEGASASVLDKSGPDRPLDYLFQGASAGCTYLLDQATFQVVQAAVRGAGEIPFGTSHDWTVYAICRSRGIGWVRDSAARIFYRQHAANVYGARSSLKGWVARLAMVRSHWYRNQIIWLGKVLVMSPIEDRVIAAVRRLNLRDRVWLACSVSKFRRRLKDRALLAASLLVGIF